MDSRIYFPRLQQTAEAETPDSILKSCHQLRSSMKATECLGRNDSELKSIAGNKSSLINAILVALVV